MKNIPAIIHLRRFPGVIALSLALLLLSGCETANGFASTTTSPSLSTPFVTTTVPKTDETIPSTTEENTTAPVTDPEPIPEVGDYRWNPYVFDRLSGEYAEDTRLLVDAILSRADGATLSTAERAQTVVDNIAFEFPPAALADFTVTGETVRITYLQSADEHQRQIAAFETAVNRGLATVSEEDSEVRRAVLLYNYVVKNVVYFSTDYTDKEITAFSALVAGKTICYGFADAFGYLLRQTGIEAHLWRGGTYTFTGFSDHGWCYAKIDGQYYHFDPTWDHSNYKSTKVNNFIYFGLSDKKRFSSLSKVCTSGFGALEEPCDVTKADERLEFMVQ
jgi:transglutaminase-like putative cysteine protease